MHSLFRCLACLLLILQALPAVAKPPPKRPAPATVVLEAEDEEPPAPPPAAHPATPPPPPEEVEADEDSSQSAGIECVPAISEVEVRRPLPFSCAVTKKGIVQVELRYKAPGRTKWTKVRFAKTDQEFSGEIPCAALTKNGVLEVSIVGMDGHDKPLARIGGVTIQVVTATNQPPPALPGREPPMRCYDASECPPELKGSPACPGTKATPGARTWGASCEKSSQCQQGLACMSGSCDKPPKCDTSAECTSGECVAGACTFPDPDEVAARLGPPKFNWIGLHVGWDLAIGKSGTGVCGKKTTDGKDNYNCYSGSDPYTGDPNDYYAGTTGGGLMSSSVRVMASFEHWFGRVGAGARVGFAFGGTPKDFNPIHVEGRFLYALRSEPMTKRFRPYLGIALGMGRVDAPSKTTIVDCPVETTAATCQAKTPEELRAGGNLAGAVEKKLDAYRLGSPVFFGPTIGAVYALANDSGIQLNINLMLPDGVFQPSLGYVLGL